MQRAFFSVTLLFALGASAQGQGIVLQISGDSNSQLSLTGEGGAPLVLAPVPGWLPTAPENLISMNRVTDDLQLVDWQRKELQTVLAEVRKKFQTRREELTTELKAESDPTKRERLQKELSNIDGDLKTELRESIDKVLLPFQRERLTQLVAQSKLNNNGGSALQNSEFAEMLKLTDEQRKELEEKQREMQEKLQQEIQELRRKRQREVIQSVLTKSQQETLKKLLGDDLTDKKKEDKK